MGKWAIDLYVVSRGENLDVGSTSVVSTSSGGHEDVAVYSCRIRGQGQHSQIVPCAGNLLARITAAPYPQRALEPYGVGGTAPLGQSMAHLTRKRRFFYWTRQLGYVGPPTELQTTA